MPDPEHLVIGRYAIFDEIASGGMATVHIGRLLGPVGFSRTVAIKRLHPQFAKDPEFVSMFVDEARLAARIRHPNVVPTLDVVKTEDELFLVMDYVQGESLSRLMRRARREGRALDPRRVVPVMAGVLHGLHAAHNAKGERGQPLHIVHRDVSPQNVLVGTDGVARVFDFGIAKARGRLQTTRDGQIKGKLAYMAPEQLSTGDVGPTTDVYAAAVVLWEALAGRRLFDGDNEGMLLAQVLEGAKYPPSTYNPSLPEELDQIVMMGLRANPSDRFASARAMAVALERSHPGASATEIGEWVEEMATETLQQRADRIAEIESQSEIDVLGRDIPVRSSRGSLGSLSNEASVNSQLSSISVARSSLGSRERGGLGRALVLGAIALGIGGLVAYMWRSSIDTQGASPAGAESAVSSAADEPTLQPSDEPSAEPSANGSAAASAALSGSAEPLASADASASASAAVVPRPPSPPLRPPRPPSTPPPSPKASQCNPPYYIDADGIRHIKPQCL